MSLPILHKETSVMGNILVKNVSGITQFFGWTEIKNGESAELPYQLAKDLATNPDYQVESHNLLNDFPFIGEDGTYLGWSSPLHYADGYGSIAQEIASSFLDSGIALSIYPRDYTPSDPGFGNYTLDEWHEKAFVPENIVDCLKGTHPIPLYGINMTWPKDVHRCQFPRRIGYTMFETTAPPASWTESMNKCQRIIVPCKQNKEAFINQGCTVPIDVVPLGVNPDKWPVIERKHDGPFTFLMAAGITMRKNPVDAAKAFVAAFPNNPDVRLRFKTRGWEASEGFRAWANNPVFRDERIWITCEESTPAQMVGYMHEADCFVFPSHSEGMGLTPIQAMCTGLPVIVADNSGMSEYCDERYNYPIPCYESKVPHVSEGGFPSEWGDVGNWWNPHFDALVEAFRAVYGDYGKAYSKGLKSAEWVRKKWTVKNTCQNLLSVVYSDARADNLLPERAF